MAEFDIADCWTRYELWQYMDSQFSCVWQIFVEAGPGLTKTIYVPGIKFLAESVSRQK